MVSRVMPIDDGFIGVIADTHGQLRPEAVAALCGAHFIVHAGDIGKPEILQDLEALAPVVAVRGNNDIGPWAEALPETLTLDIGMGEIYVLHDVKTLDFDPAEKALKAVIAGHSHRPKIEERGGVLWINPGSAGPRRFRLPIGVARLHVHAATLHAEWVGLDV
jgi:putative phosphoesterase